MTEMRDAVVAGALLCPQCGTELAAAALACPACNTIINADRLKELAAAAAQHAANGQLVEARDTWLQVLELLPANSQQHSAITARVTELSKRIEANEGAASKPAAHGPWWKRGFAAVATVVLLLLGKLKFLLLGLTKASTFLSMFAFFGVYWATYGWPLAAGLVISIYIHEMGHVAEIRRLGIKTGAPFFIPGLGAVVMLKQRVDDPLVDARIGLAGPIWGLGAALASYAVFAVTKAPIWLAIAELGAFLNLFNLIPIWQLDGSRGFHALSSAQRFIVTLVIGAVYFATHQKMLLIVGAVAAFRSFQKNSVPGDLGTLLKFAGLVAVLAFMTLRVA